MDLGVHWQNHIIDIVRISQGNIRLTMQAYDLNWYLPIEFVDTLFEIKSTASNLIIGSINKNSNHWRRVTQLYKYVVYD